MNGAVGSRGDATTYGDLAGIQAAPIVAAAMTPTGRGYWLVGADGGVFAFGDAHFFGSLGGHPLNSHIVGIAATPSGAGYWLVAADGGLFSFGDAVFAGSLGGRPLGAPIVGMARTSSGRGYWFVGSDGGVFTFGDATFFGSTGGQRLNAPITGLAPTPASDGYWLVASDGGVFSFGNATYLGSMGGHPLAAPVVSMASTSTGRGYWLIGADGGVFTFGDATFAGPAEANPAYPVVAILPAADNRGYDLVTGTALPVVPPLVPLGTFSATCYDLPGTTATGQPVSTSVVAVDPSVIPLGTPLFLQGVGIRYAEDTGGGIKGARIDVWLPDLNSCMAFGVQSLQVWRIG
jgi:3D (Asp-Asp-Asp) domain-containing protein